MKLTEFEIDALINNKPIPYERKEMSTDPKQWKIKETKIGTTEQKIEKGKPVQSQGPNLYNPSFSKNQNVQED